MKLKEIGIWIAVVAVLIGGLWLLVTSVNNSPSPSAPLAIKLPEVTNKDFIRGPESASGSARVTLVEYADFQCPACANYFPLVRQLSAEFSRDLRIVHRFFPLTNIHKNSMIAAQAAYAAGLQGKFWEMHDLLYENQSLWTDINPKDTFIGYAGDLELDLDKFKKDLEADATKQFISDEQTKGIAIGINSTPTFFVNGKHIQNPQGYEAFKQIIQNEINKK